MTNSPPNPAPSHVVICGGGVIGACIAYYLSERNLEVTLVERTGIANAASGKSGGFLARDWCRDTAVDELAQRSFALHAELAASLGIDWGYRRLETLSVAASQNRAVRSLARLPSPDWLAASAAVHGQLGSEATTAQVHPGRFTAGMLQAAQDNGAQVLLGTVEGVTLSQDKRRIASVLVDGSPLETDAVVIAMGPWSLLACKWLPLPGVYGLKGHSLLFDYAPPNPKALFLEIETETGEIETPEIMPRTDGTTYVCGLSRETAVPLDPADVSEDEGAPQRLRALTATVAPQLAAAEVLAVQACYRPVTTDGIPLIGAVPPVAGAYVATGHSVWGILNGPATGEAMAELIVDGAATTIDIAPFDPQRLNPFKDQLP